MFFNRRKVKRRNYCGLRRGGLREKKFRQSPGGGKHSYETPGSYLSGGEGNKMVGGLCHMSPSKNYGNKVPVQVGWPSRIELKGSVFRKTPDSTGKISPGFWVLRKKRGRTINGMSLDEGDSQFARTSVAHNRAIRGGGGERFHWVW